MKRSRPPREVKFGYNPEFRSLNYRFVNTRNGKAGVARQSKPLLQRQSAIHPMVEQRSVGKLVSSPKPPEVGAQRARLYTSLITGHHNSRMQLTLEEAHSRQ